MKKFLTLALVFCLVFSSSSIVFATPTQWDTSDSNHLTGIYNSLVSTSSSGVLRALNSIYDVLTSTTSNYSLYAIASYLYDIRSYLSGSGSSGIASILNSILNELAYTNAGGTLIHGIQVLVGYINSIRTDAITIAQQSQLLNQAAGYINNHLVDIKTNTANIKTDTGNIYTVTNANLPSISSYLRSINLKYTDEFGWLGSNSITIPELLASGMYQTQSQSVSNFYTGTLNSLSALHSFNVQSYNQMFDRTVGVSFNRTSWDDLSTVTFTPYSLGNGIIRMMQYIQTPIARLAYVHASDEEIAAREKAEANQTAVVDNFIDPTGSGSLPTSSIGSVSDMSDSFKDNFSTDASPTGLFDIFNSDHGSWFSQETADQLDTTNLNNRSLKAAPSDNFDTPLLDQQIDDIYNALGVKK